MNILFLFFGIMMVGGLVALLALPIIALIRSRKIGELSERVEQLEYEVSRLRRAARAAAPPAVVAEAVEEEEPAEVVLVTAAEPAPPVQHKPIPHRRRETDAATLESWVGQKGLGWAAVVLLLFATAFFLKYAFENQWIGELGRVSMGIAAGAGLCVGGLAAHRRKHRLTSQMLSAAGVALLYLTTFSAFGYYHLLPRDRAGIFLILVVVETAALAVLYDAPAIAVMAIVGGLLSPVLLRSDHDRYVSLFCYLAALNAGVVGLALFRRWLFLAPIGLLGAQALFWSWYFERYHPEKLVAAVVFQAVLFALYLGHDLVVPAVRRQRAHIIQVIQLLVNAFFFSLAGYVLLAEDHRLWLPTAAVGLAAIYAGLTWLVQRRLGEDGWLQLSCVSTSLALMAIACALRGEAAWISLGWAVEGAALWWFGLRIRAEPLRWLGAGLLFLGVWRLVLMDTPWRGRAEFIPIFNRYALPALAVSACVLVSARAVRRYLDSDSGGHEHGEYLADVDRTAWWVLGLGGVMMVWMILSLETYQYAVFPRIVSVINPADRERFAEMSLSMFWAVYAGVILALGFWRSSRPLRVTALGLFGLTLAKVVLIDMAGLPGIFRVVAFFALAVVMGAAAWTYQRIEARRQPSA